MIKTVQQYLKISAASHPGMKGKQNEDRYQVTHFLTGRKGKIPSTLAVLCDGIGGHRAGEVAAEMGVSIITETIAAGDASQPLKTMADAVSRASDDIFAASRTDQRRSGMGATCACAWVIGERLYTVNLGDSRIYLFREGYLFQLTTDHTWIQEALDAGIISGDEGGSHPNAHVIRRYLGSKKRPEPDFRLWMFDGEKDEDALNNQGMRLKPGDILMLCSDGLTDLTSDAEIRDVIQSHPFEQVPGLLIEEANRRGGHDNTTVVLMQVPLKSRALRRRRWGVGCLVALAVISLVVAALLFGLRSWGDKLDEVQPSPSITMTLPSSLKTSIPTVTFEETMTETVEVPQPSITPWPTDTNSP
jgi:protein phosphatase